MKLMNLPYVTDALKDATSSTFSYNNCMNCGLLLSKDAQLLKYTNFLLNFSHIAALQLYILHHFHG